MVVIAGSLADVERRAQRFFESNTTRTKELHDVLLSELLKIGSVNVIGGAIRDLAFFGADERPISDFDLVIAGDWRKVRAFAHSIGAQENRFGGFGFKSQSMKVDFWALNKTWAKVAKCVRISQPRHLLNSTFFDWDAIIYDVDDGSIKAIDRYISRLQSRILEINLPDTPSVHGNLVRALRRLVMFDGKPGRNLRRFISKELVFHNWRSIVEAERNAFHVQYLDQYNSRLDFYRRFLTNRNRSVPGVDDRRQLTLPLQY
jgi:hypothetical protein